MNRKEEKNLADLLDREKMAGEDRIPASQDEFERIMAEMDRRGIAPQIRKELKQKKKNKKK